MPTASFWPSLIFEVAWGWDPLSSQYTMTFSSISTNGACYVDLGAVSDYVVQSGDYLEYDVYWEFNAAQYIAVDLYNNDDAVYLGQTAAVDQNGKAAAVNTDLPAAYSAWYHRIIPLPSSWYGNTITKFDLAIDIAGTGFSGTFVGYFRDVLISDGAGNARQVIWGQGEGNKGPILDKSVGSGGYTPAIDPPITGAPSYIPISSRVLEATIARGRQRELDQIETGTMELVCDNSDGALDPANTSGPYYPYVLPLRLIRARATHPLPNLLPYGGFADSTSGVFGAGWTTFLQGAAGLSPQLSAAFEGSLGALGTGTGTGDFGTVQSLFDVPIDPTQSYTLSAYFRKASGSVSAHSRLRVFCFDKLGNGLGAVYPTTATAGLTLSTPSDFDPTGSFVRYGGVIRPQDWPAGTVKCKVEASPVRGPTASVSVGVDALQIELGNTVSAFSASVNYYLFSGYIERYPSTQSGRHNEVTLSCSDAFILLAQATTNEYRPTQVSDDRILSVLLDAGFPRSRYIHAAGQTSVQPLGVVSGQSTEINVMQHILDVTDAELGYFFIDGQGQARFLSRNSRAATPSSATLYDQPTDASGLNYYLDIVPTTDPDLIYNFIAFTPFPGGSTYYAQDYNSQRKYGKRTLEGAPIVSTADEAQQRAYYLLIRYREPAQRFDSLRIDPARRDGHWLQVLARELSDKITVQRTATVGGPTVVKDVFIEHLEHAISARPDEPKRWSTTYQLSPADANTYWTLAGTIGDVYSPSSILGSTTRLGF